VLQVLSPGLWYGDYLNKTSFHEHWLTKTDWKWQQKHYRALKISSASAVQELSSIFPPYCMYWIWPVIPLNSMKSSRLGVSLLPLSSFLTFKICLARTQPSPSPALLCFTLLCSWPRKAFLPDYQEGLSPVENAPTHVYLEKHGSSFATLSRFWSCCLRDPLEYFLVYKGSHNSNSQVIEKAPKHISLFIGFSLYQVLWAKHESTWNSIKVTFIYLKKEKKKKILGSLSL
jgi:hypothetical protein